MKGTCCQHQSPNKNLKTPENPKGVYTCPILPEVREVGPGSCPKCGMALEPLLGESSDDSEYKDMLRRFFLAAAFSFPLLIVAMGDMLPGKPISSFSLKLLGATLS